MSDTTSAAFAQAAASEKLSLLLAKVSSEALVSQNRDVFFNNALRELGQCLEAGRVYLFRKSNGLGTIPTNGAPRASRRSHPRFRISRPKRSAGS